MIRHRTVAASLPAARAPRDRAHGRSWAFPPVALSFELG
jgi:hypothetical protein